MTASKMKGKPRLNLMRTLIVLAAALTISSASCKERSAKKIYPLLPAQHHNPPHDKAWENFHKTIQPLTPLDQGELHQLRVLHVIDKRLDNLSAQDYAKLYQIIEEKTKVHLGFTVELQAVGEIGIDEYFEQGRRHFEKPHYRQYIMEGYLDPRWDDAILRQTVAQAIAHLDDRSLLRYIRAGSPDNHPPETMLLENRATAENLFYERFMQLSSQLRKVKSGGVVVQAPEYLHTQAYHYWLILLMEETRADIILTNTIIAGADSAMPLYVINRGGVTTGVTENNFHNFYAGISMVAALPITSNDPFFVSRRGEIPQGELLETIAAMVVHELGHLMLRLVEYYDLPGSIHNAPVDLDYYGWYKGLRREKTQYDNLRRLSKF